MTRSVAPIICACLIVSGKSAFAHRIDEYLQATILSLDTDRVHASMRLIPGMLVSSTVISSIDTNGDGVFSAAEERAYSQQVLDDLSITIDGKSVEPKLDSWTFPQPAQMREGLGEIHIIFTADLPQGAQNRSLIVSNSHLARTSVYLMNVLEPQDRSIRIVAQKRNPQQSIYELDYQQEPATASAANTPGTSARLWLNGLQFSSLFHLGMRHIAEGTDHLLFLLVLLLPAPLLISSSHWGPPTQMRQTLLRILGIVTAFTVGHSITLALAALGAVHVPGRPVEVLIAFSILISAAHAFRPIFPGKEAYVAAFFGLVHGLAFASTLDSLGFSLWGRVAGILSFNLGIEAMQMLVVAAVLPSLMLMSRTPGYPILRIGGAILAGAASVGWILERLFGIDARVDIIANGLAQHGLMIAVNLLLVSLACRFLPVDHIAPGRLRNQHSGR